jgi:hypothetical protein
MRTITTRRLGRSLTTAAVAAATLGVLAGPVDASVGAKKAKSACGLLTTGEIQRAFGVPVADGEQSREFAGSGGQCEWQVGDRDGDGENGNVTARVDRSKNAKLGYRTAKKLSIAPVKVTGLGKEAYYDPQTGVLDVLKNNKTSLFLSATIFKPGLTAARKDPAELQPVLQGLAKAALGRA